MTGSKIVQLASLDETSFFADPDRKVIHEHAAKVLRLWQMEADSKNTYFMPVELEIDSDGVAYRRLYMEATQISWDAQMIAK